MKSLAKYLSIMFIISKKLVLGFIDLFIVFQYLFYLFFDLYYFFLLLTLGFVLLFLIPLDDMFISDFSCFLTQACTAINFLLELFFLHPEDSRRLPMWYSGKESTCQCKGCKRWWLDWEDPLEEEMVTHSNILAWEIPWTLVGYSPWGCNELDMTEYTTQHKDFRKLCFHFHCLHIFSYFFFDVFIDPFFF